MTEPWLHRLSAAMKSAVSAYTGGASEKRPKLYERINGMLRGTVHETRELRKTAEIISKSILQFDLNSNIIAYRGEDADYLSKIAVGDCFPFKTFYSASASRGGAIDNSFIVVIFSREGTKYAYIEGLSHYPTKKNYCLIKRTLRDC